MGGTSSVQIVEEFWDAVWNGRNPDAIDRFVVDDFILVSGGKEIRSKENFRQ
jgi:hypothetical protein